ncbi:ScyD/ScyE family protein (plasmid) [Polymorphobacter sp. PAMC 29334]|uniref:ScyD/ScyE family protein n=1 Tax=Polymorphobacter sp. PAMC 29334 TaxID=2862331 RepID=UPI001C75C19E|nr:ScyD/ScyE family protein [Polymorphobacter sp. PAMC 29334]QYE37292.1 ScyD/ScyE family protein [Polymorphobacter sp. PAMC 29334]
MKKQLINYAIVGLLTATALSATAAVAKAYTTTVVASHLNNPRGLAFGADGGLYIAESGYYSGTAGPGLTASNGEFEEYQSTGSITRVAGGIQQRVVTGLAALVNPVTGEATGPQDIAFGTDGKGYVVIGLGAPPSVRTGALGAAPGAGALGHVFSFNGASLTDFADVSAFETANDPDHAGPDSNPYHLTAGAGGSLLVTDAGANTLLNVGSSGTVSLGAVFPLRFIGAPFPSQAVPTGVAVGPDGLTYVAELTGYPFTPGAADIFRVAADGTVSPYLTGFTDIGDIAFAPDGTLYVLEVDADGLANATPGGALIRVGTDGSRQTILSRGLIVPTGLTVGHDGAVYLTNFTGSPGIGEVLRVAAVPEPATWALMVSGFGVIGSMMRRTVSRVVTA